ncbi:MAG: hypothetical protein ACKOCO_00085, partial [Bacteroidota bacterium]
MTGYFSGKRSVPQKIPLCVVLRVTLRHTLRNSAVNSLRNSAVKQKHSAPGIQERTARTCLKIIPDAENIEKSSQFPGDFRL